MRTSGEGRGSVWAASLPPLGEVEPRTNRRPPIDGCSQRGREHQVLILQGRACHSPLQLLSCAMTTESSKLTIPLSRSTVAMSISAATEPIEFNSPHADRQYERLTIIEDVYSATPRDIR